MMIFHAAIRASTSRAVVRTLATSLLVALPLGAVAATLSDTPDTTYVTDGQVSAIVRVDDTIYIGGLFGRVGPRTGPGVELAPDGTRNTSSPEISGAGPTLIPGSGDGVRAVADDGAGGWYIGGRFSHVGSTAVNNIAHIRADYSVDTNFRPALDGYVDALVVSGTKVFIAGFFATVDGATRNNIASVDASTGAVNPFDPNADNEVLALALSSDGSIVYAGGIGFTTIGGQPRAALAALDATSGAATPTFNPNPTGFSGTPIVSALAVSGSTLYVGGTFVAIGGADRASIAALSLGGASDGNAVAAFDPSPSYFGCSFCSNIAALVVDGSIVYAGGSFDTIAGQPRSNLAALNAADGTATAFDAAPDANILSLTAAGATIYVGGGFRTIGGQPRNYLAALDAASGDASAFDPEPNGTVSSIGVSATAVYLGGDFSSLGGVARSSMAAISAIDGTVTDWNPDPQGSDGGGASINTLAVSKSILYVGGYFASIAGQSRSNIAAVNIASATATNWAPDADGVVATIAVADDLVYVGGSFIHIGIGGDQRIFLAALNADDASATAWDPSPDGDISAVVPSGDLVYVGGTFVHIGSNFEARTRIAALNASDGNPTAWDPDAGDNSGVLAIAVSGSIIYAGGYFTTMHGVPRNNIAAISADDGTVTPFDPDALDGSVEALAVDGSTVYAGGRFAVMGGQPRGMIAALDANDGELLAFDPYASGTVISALTLAADGTLYVGGLFSTFELASQSGFAAFTPIVKNEVIFVDGFDGP